MWFHLTTEVMKSYRATKTIVGACYSCVSRKTTDFPPVIGLFTTITITTPGLTITNFALQHELPRCDQKELSHWEGSILVIVASNQNTMKLRIPPKYHGPLAALGFLLIMILVGIIESIGGVN